MNKFLTKVSGGEINLGNVNSRGSSTITDNSTKSYIGNTKEFDTKKVKGITIDTTIDIL